MSHNEVDHIKNVITNLRRRLQKLEEQKARFGLYTPPHILIEIEDIKEKFAELQEQLSTPATSTPPNIAKQIKGIERKINRLEKLVKQPSRNPIAMATMLFGLPFIGVVCLLGLIVVGLIFRGDIVRMLQPPTPTSGSGRPPTVALPSVSSPTFTSTIILTDTPTLEPTEELDETSTPTPTPPTDTPTPTDTPIYTPTPADTIVESPSFQAKVCLIAQDTGENVSGATVKIITPHIEVEARTDPNGCVEFQFNNIYLGEAGLLSVSVDDFEDYERDIDLVSDIIWVELKRLSTPTRTPMPTNPPLNTPTFTPTPTDTPPPIVIPLEEWPENEQGAVELFAKGQESEWTQHQSGSWTLTAVWPPIEVFIPTGITFEGYNDGPDPPATFKCYTVLGSDQVTVQGGTFWYPIDPSDPAWTAKYVHKERPDENCITIGFTPD